MKVSLFFHFQLAIKTVLNAMALTIITVPYALAPLLSPHKVLVRSGVLYSPQELEMCVFVSLDPDRSMCSGKLQIV